VRIWEIHFVKDVHLPNGDRNSWITVRQNDKGNLSVATREHVLEIYDGNDMWSYPWHMVESVTTVGWLR
jgi:hypothetical protein